MKFKNLARRLGSQPLAVGTLEMLWHATAENTPDGGIGRFTDSELEAELEWRGEAGALIEILCETRWLDRIADPERLYVHDWHEHADYATHRKLARGRLWFVSGEAPKCSTLQEKERKAATEFYASNPRSTRDLLTKSLQGQEQEHMQGQEQEQSRAGRSTRSIPPWALSCSEILIELLRCTEGARIPRGAHDRWASEIAAIPREVPSLSANGADPAPHIEAGIRWALGPENLGREYEVVIRSGKALREKWPKLVAAARRYRERGRGKREMDAWVKSYETS